MKYNKHFNPTVTPQTEQADPRQVQNSAGGFTFALTPMKRLERFLVLGSESNTYYATAKKLTKENGKCILECLNEDPAKTIETIAEFSESGRIPKNDTAIFALALAVSHDNPEVRKMAVAVANRVCRTGTHLFQLVSQANEMRGWGRTLKRLVANWYNQKNPDQLAYQVLKYQNRESWSHRDVLRKAHVQAENSGTNAVLRYVVSGAEGLGNRVLQDKKKSRVVREYPGVETVPALLSGYEALKKASSVGEVVSLIEAHGFSHDMIPTQWKNSAEVWDALLPKMPMTALVRNLNKLTQLGLLKPFSDNQKAVCEKLANEDLLRKARVHPIQMLSALKTYSKGHGERGSLTWAPEQKVVDALDAGFYSAFKAVEPTNKNILVALDVSGSMTWGEIAGVPGLNPRLASAALAMLFARTEKNTHIVGFASSGNYGGQSGLAVLKISPTQRLDDVIKYIEQVPMGGTDCSLPMLYALDQRLDVDCFLTVTDNETWAGVMHPHQALKKFRVGMGKPTAKNCVIGMTATDFTVADPSDTNSLDFVGFDSAAPQILSDFIRN